MRTLVIILCGVLLWTLCITAGKLLTGHLGVSITRATLVFLVLWLVAAALARLVRWRIH
jgi:hypothetical protein